MFKPKIIHIIGHSPGPGAHLDISDSSVRLPRHYIRTSQPPYWVGFFEEDFYVMVANEITKKSEKYVNECWRPYIGCDKVYTREINGVIHRLFPSTPAKTIKLGSEHHIGIETSPSLIERLKEEVKKGNIIVHFHGFPGGPNDYILSRVSLESVPVVVQHRGSSFQFERYAIRRTLISYLLSFLYRIIEYKRAKTLYFNNIDLFFFGTIYELRTLNDMGLNNTKLLKDGRDFNLFKIKNREDVRKKLKLPINKRIALYVGGFKKGRGVHKILNVYKKISDKMNLMFIFIGGEKSDEYYNMVSESGALFLPRIDRKELINYYNASDFTITIDSDYFQRYYGFSGTPFEGNACGIPAVARNLVNFWGTHEERKQLGEIPKSTNEKDIESSIVRILESPEKYSRCREIVEKYYHINVTIQKNLKAYEWLSKKYYNV